MKPKSCWDALEEPFEPVLPGLPLLLVVAAALTDADGRVLLAKRPEGKSMAGMWEFPGGKVDPGETPEVALVRELREELGIETRPCCFTPAGFASHSYGDFHILLPLFVCRAWKGEIVPAEGQETCWVYPQNMPGLSMPEADRPLVAQLMELL